MSVFSPAIARLQQALATSIPTCCEEINRMVHECSIKELEGVFPTLLSSIFELSPQKPGGWSLKTTRAANTRTFDQVRYMLSPSGPIIELCYKLLSDQHIKYEYPLVYIPVSTRQMLEEGIIPPFYAGKLQCHSQLRVPTSLLLNPFEYYMMHFTHYLVNPALPGQQFSNSSSDILYLVILEDYLKYFLPCNGSNLPPIPAPSQPVSSTVPTPVKPIPTIPTSTLLKKSVLLPSSPNKPPPAAYAVDKASEQDTWRTQVLLQSILENWLSQASPKDRSPRTGSSSPKSYRDSVFLPGLDHLRGVRMTIKHLHYFANSTGPNVITGLDKLKRTVWTWFQKKLYFFMRHTMEHWPLDASFRLFLETWLSYIQPWRYTTRNSEDDRYVEPKYHSFIAENILFYTHFLHKIALRFLRLDLASSKDALMLYRVAKVFSQSNLKELIAAVDSVIVEGQSSSQSGSSPLAITARQSVDELEGPTYIYCSIFGTEFQVVVKQLLNSIALAKHTLLNQQQEETEVARNTGIVGWIRNFLHNVSLTDLDFAADDSKKTLSHLEFASTHLARFFNVEAPDELEFIHNTPTTSRMPASPSSRRWDTADTTSLSQSILQPRRFPDLKHRGNPDTATIRTYEIAALVRFFHKVCSFINEKYGADLENN